MKDKLASILNILLVLLLAVSAILLVVFYYGTSLYNSDTEFAEQISVLGWRLDAYLNWSFVLIAIAAIAAIGFPIVNMITNPAGSKKALISVAVIAVVIAVSYAMANGDILIFPGYKEFFYDDISMDPHKFSRYVGTGLWTMYILGAISVLSMVYVEVAKFFK